MSEHPVKNFRRLPQGAKTRDELKALIVKHGSLTERQVLEHINKCCKPPWTHEDFVNFFVISEQIVFRERGGRLYLAPQDSDGTSEEDASDVRTLLKDRSPNRHRSLLSSVVLRKYREKNFGSVDTEDSSAAESERRRKELPGPVRMPSDYSSDEGSGGDALTVEDVIQMKRARRRHFPKHADPKKLVTLDPGCSNKAPPKVRLGTLGSKDDSGS